MNIWNFIENKLSEGKSLYLMIVIETHGSSPGKQGFSMAVSSDDNLKGSIGGGSMEFKLVEKCKKMLAANQQEFFIMRQVHKGNITDGSGMMCSGEQTIAFVPLTASDVQDIVSIATCISKKKTGVFKVNAAGYNFELLEEMPKSQYHCTITNKNVWNYNETIGFKNTVYIVGAGHVGFAVSKLFSQLGFKVVLFDNRPDLNMINENPYADEKMVIDYKNIHDYITEGENIYVIIMTNNHTYDKAVLSLVVRKKVKYLGMMGSKEKVAAIKNQMIDDGFSEKELHHLHAPIGISIRSETPDEIAVSIAAEIIKIKNSN